MLQLTRWHAWTLGCALVSLALSACDHETGGTAGAAAAADSLPPARAAAADTLPPTEIGPGEFTLQPGQPWSDVARFLGDASKAGFAKAFPATETQHVPLCDSCADAHLTIFPETRVRNLKVEQLPGRRRIVARVTVDRLDPAGRSSDLLRWLGLGADNPSREAYLVSTGDSAAVFIYNTGDTINLASRRWRFWADRDEHQLRYSMARWGSVLHVGEKGLAIDPHVAGIWLSCAEGCCNAQPQ
jgi:hypothetical protein